MKTTGLKIWSILMANWLLFSSLGISIHTHYCQGSVKNKSLYTAAEKCKNEKKQSCLSAHTQHTVKRAACCFDTHDLHQFSADFLGINKDNNQQDWVGLAALLDLTKDRMAVASTSITYPCYRPPPDFTDRRILYQSFLL